MGRQKGSKNKTYWEQVRETVAEIEYRKYMAKMKKEGKKFLYKKDNKNIKEVK